MDLLSQLNAAMRYVEAHLDDDIALGDASSVTSYSPYHFGRLFYYIAGISLSEYIRRRKLSLAGAELQAGSARVLDLAVKYGYDSADSFSRAFAKQHGVTPTAARRPGVTLKIFSPLTFQIKVQGAEEMNWRIEEREAFEVAGIKRFFLNGESGNISAWWTETRENGSQAKLTEQLGRSGLIGVCECADGRDDGFDYMIGLPVCAGDNTDGCTVVNVPRTTFAVFRSDEIRGYGQQIPELFSRAYSEWLPSSGYTKADGADMEIYGADDKGKLYEEVWIPVKKQ
ncbi:MAG: AraC family transcriptional regulator [Oscillospiraceae bacterium]|jgi:AraC family transcriptional regulator|nr:AraC family transcriptional regulator [Oscillospiraceae bacterium]